MSFFAKHLARRVLTPTFAAIKKTNFSTTSAVFVPRVQQPAPKFSATAVVNGEFSEIKLEDFNGKYVVLFFYPMDFTFVCPTELIAFSEKAKDFASIDCQVIGASTDSEFSHLAWINTPRKVNFTFVCPTELIAFSEKAKDFASIDCQVIGASTDSEFSHLAWINTPRKDGGLGKIDFPLLADYNKVISKNYDVLLDQGFALRGLFIIDRKGILRHMSINDLPVGRSVDETLRLVKAFQFADKHGEVCPANWNPESNADTIKPNPKESKAYFEKAN